ncbi:hypothetical protein QQS21_006806 [Conoideocrella luteorostrata]|uniref:Uncharacterized protein n=1 Tax=Conoideocrella luteorostrata TaxID=1105319 RepID=A0AAJ0FSL6_9HYPO|nr:hypothetical protein QQS21_006806 [Conoideocrella luteorostrata]
MPSFLYLAHFESDPDLTDKDSEKNFDKMSFTKQNSSVSYRSTKPTKKQRVRTHFKRFWWLHLLLWLCIAALFVCLSIFVFVPIAAQNKVNAASLEIQGVNIIEAKPNSFLIQINSTIRTDGQFKADLDPFEGDLTLTDIPNARPFMTIKFPHTNADEFQAINISQTIDITDKAAFAQFNQVFFQNETLEIDIVGRTNVQPRGLSKKYPVDFKKRVEFKGLNLLNGTKIENAKLGSDGDAPNFNATAIIMNRSYYTLDLGNATFQNFADGQYVGMLNVTYLILRPGLNTVNITSRINQTGVLEIVKKPSFCKTGIIPFQLHGTRVENNGQEIPWLEAALSSANQTVDINVGELLGSAGTSFCVS